MRVCWLFLFPLREIFPALKWSLHQPSEDFKMQTTPQFPALDQESRSHVDTACAAFHLMRKPQTMRAYACLENGPIRPHRINGRLAWAVADIKRLLNGGANA
jgi:hypothetical protein